MHTKLSFVYEPLTMSMVLYYDVFHLLQQPNTNHGSGLYEVYTPLYNLLRNLLYNLLLGYSENYFGGA